MLLIYTKTVTNRLKYVFDFVLNEQLGLQYKLCDDINYFLQSAAKKMVYADENVDADAFFISAHSLLFGDDIQETDLHVGSVLHTQVLFINQQKDDLGFDVFAAIFYLISRYEEYLDKPKDKFGNYNFRYSILHQLGLLHIPIIEQWFILFKEALLKKFPALEFKKHKPGFVLTFDVDVAYAYKNRSVERTAGGLFKKLLKFQFAHLADQLLTLLNIRKDKNDTFGYILQSIKNNKALFFFNMGSYAQFDKNPSYKNKAFQKMVRTINTTQLVGLHPSYASNTNASLLQTEKKWLENIIAQPVTKSRQHYLKLRFPSTYHQLNQNNIAEDYTIGYHDAFGFRAGTSKPFFFFNLHENQSTSLRLFPFIIMDGTLNDVMKLNFADAKKMVAELVQTTKTHNGLFISVWHNSTLSDADNWKGWREIFEYMLEQIKENKLENIIQ